MEGSHLESFRLPSPSLPFDSSVETDEDLHDPEAMQWEDAAAGSDEVIDLGLVSPILADTVASAKKDSAQNGSW